MDTMDEVAAFTRGADMLGMVQLTADDVKRLRQPYHTNAVKWLPIGELGERGTMMMPHIDASLVIERLSDVDPGWSEHTEPVLLLADPSDPMGLNHQSPWRCTLTVKGTTRVGYGQLDNLSSKMDGKHVKAGESDALKRAALKFGVGAYLRAIPMIWLPRQVGGADAIKVRRNGKYGGLTPIGKKFLRAEYEKVVTHDAFTERYGDMVDYGDLEDEVEDVAIREAEPEAAVSDLAVEVLVLLSRFTGRGTPEHQVRAQAEAQPFRKLLPGALSGIKGRLGLSAGDTENLRTLATKAAEGDAGALSDLEDALDQLAPQAGDDTQETMPV